MRWQLTRLKVVQIVSFDTITSFNFKKAAILDFLAFSYDTRNLPYLV